MIRLLAFLLLMLASAGAAQAENRPLGGAGLMNYCKGLYDVDAGFCAGYVSAIADLMQQQALSGYTACNLAPVPSQQLMELIQIQLQNDKTAQAKPATQMTAETLARFYPCR